MTRRDVVYHTIQWAKERDILEQGTVKGQIEKLFEEVEELELAVLKNDRAGRIDAIGDIQVVLEIISEMLGINSEMALESAYNEIKNRKGKMINGVFVKESDLNKNSLDYGDPMDWKWINEGERP